MPQSIKTTFLYSFLTHSKYRILRHVLLIIFVLLIISLNQTYITYQPNFEALGSKIYLLAFITAIIYATLVYLNLYILVPKLLRKKKYFSYITILSALVLLLVIGMDVLEYITYTLLDIPHIRSSYLNYVAFLNGISNFTINMLCISGGSMIVLLKYWMENEQVVNQLRNEQIESEVEQLKDQINPQFLFNILNRASVLTKTNPKLASDMLLKLSHLLRYQLYDCSRDKVLLSSEITFLTNYLDLEKLYFDKFNYTISSQGDVHWIFIAPMLFTPFVQNTINRIQTQDQEFTIDLHFKLDGRIVYFTYQSDNYNIPSDGELVGIKQRLDILYQNNYTLSTKNRIINLELRS